MRRTEPRRTGEESQSRKQWRYWYSRSSLQTFSGVTIHFVPRENSCRVHFVVWRLSPWVTKPGEKWNALLCRSRLIRHSWPSQHQSRCGNCHALWLLQRWARGGKSYGNYEKPYLRKCWPDPCWESPSKVSSSRFASLESHFPVILMCLASVFCQLLLVFFLDFFLQLLLLALWSSLLLPWDSWALNLLLRLLMWSFLSFMILLSGCWAHLPASISSKSLL